MNIFLEAYEANTVLSVLVLKLLGCLVKEKKNLKVYARKIMSKAASGFLFHISLMSSVDLSVFIHSWVSEQF
jgi:hypothetical protein